MLSFVLDLIFVPIHPILGSIAIYSWFYDTRYVVVISLLIH